MMILVLFVLYVILGIFHLKYSAIFETLNSTHSNIHLFNLFLPPFHKNQGNFSHSDRHPAWASLPGLGNTSCCCIGVSLAHWLHLLTGHWMLACDWSAPAHSSPWLAEPRWLPDAWPGLSRETHCLETEREHREHILTRGTPRHNWWSEMPVQQLNNCR